MTVSTNKVFRLSRCPGDVDETTLAFMLSNAFGDIVATDILIKSLARGHGLDNTSRTATLMFKKLPSLLQDSPDKTSWRIDLNGILSLGGDRTGTEALYVVLDTHFEGFTPLNDAKGDDEAIDCIVISGLASHPFGSWQEKGSDKSYMWVRDALPRYLPNVRAILYGYDTTLVDSRSFQSIGEISGTLRDRLIPMAYSTAHSRPIIFLAHSLGGIVLKKTLVMLADSGPEGIRLLNLIYGGILFGVPNQGMDQEALMTVVRGQTNQALVSNLAKGSLHLMELDKSFSGIGSTHWMKFNWAYETRETRTVSRNSDGRFVKEGPLAVLVTRESATRGLFGSDFKNTFAIDKDHSDMVKYSDQDPVCGDVIMKLRDICTGGRSLSTGNELWHHRSSGHRQPRGLGDLGTSDTEIPQDTWVQELKDMLFVPEMDGRYATIEDKSANTFEWIFNRSETGFVEWLEHGEGLFWIQGKPGSGKSTLMRFIARDDRTERYLEGNDLISQPTQIIRSRHFFHSRGTILQKSFEGLLRSILYQILNASPRLSGSLRSVFEDNLWSTSQHANNLWTNHNLRKCLHHILKQSTYDVSYFILLDALDEYDGTPEYVSKFLKDLLKSSGAKTKVKILFSSRPWESFREPFSDVPGLHLQEHNQSDIKTYCENTIREQDPQLRSLLPPLIPEIVRRSEGVFIWVKYILEELMEGATSGQSFQQLPALLDSLPTDLGDYYTSVIRRIDQKDRRNAYALFQLVTSRTDDYNIDSMDLIFAHSVWNCSTYREAQTSFDQLMRAWVPDSLKSKFTAGVTFTNSFQRDQRFVRPRYLINRFGKSEIFTELKKKIFILSGGLIHAAKHPGISQPSDLVQAQLDRLVQNDIVPRRTASALKPLFTKFTDEDQEPFSLEPTHQTVYEFIKRPSFKDLLLENDADFVHENRLTWLTKLFFAQNLLRDAGCTCLLSELTTGRSMATFIDSVPQEAWKQMYEEDFLDAMKGADTMIDSPLKFAAIYGLALYLKDVLNCDENAFRNTTDELILIPPARYYFFVEDLDDGRWKLVVGGEVFLERHLNVTRMILRGGYSYQKAQAAFLKLMWILGALTLAETFFIHGHHFDCWSDRVAEAKGAVLVELGQDPDIQVTGVRATHEYSVVRNKEIKWRPIHVASLKFTKALHMAGASLNGEDGQGNTALDWLLALWDTRKSRKSRGLAHSLVEGVSGGARRDRWGKIGYLLENGGVTKTTPGRVWQSFIAQHVESLQKQSVRVAQEHQYPSGNEQRGTEAANPSLVRDNTLLSVSTSSTGTVAGFSDVFTRIEAGVVVTYTNLGDDGNLLDSYFHDIEQAEIYLRGLPVATSASEDHGEVRRQRRFFPWRSRS